jgi:hypothetical protein
MQNNRLDSPAVPAGPKLSERTIVEQTDLRRCVESLQWIICDLLSENEKLRQLLAGRTSSYRSSSVEPIS